MIGFLPFLSWIGMVEEGILPENDCLYNSNIQLLVNQTPVVHISFGQSGSDLELYVEARSGELGPTFSR